MSEFLDRLSEELTRWDVARVTESSVELAAEIDALQTRHDELMGVVPFWARAAFFLDTEEEFQARELRARIAELRKRIVTLDSDLDTRLERVGEQLAPFGVALDVERAVRAARSVLEGEGTAFSSIGDRKPLHEALDTLSSRVLSTWVPDLDLDAVSALGRDPGAARAAELDAPGAFEFDPYTWWRPISHAQLAGAVASHLVHESYFQRLEAADALDDELIDAEISFDQAREHVSWVDRVNVFSRSQAENEADQARADLAAMRHHRELTRELLFHLVASSIDVFAPLAIARHAREVRGALDALDAQRVDTLGPDGSIDRRPVVAHAAALLSATSRLRASVAHAFPRMPQPSTIVGDPPASILDDAHDAWLDSFYASLDSSDAPDDLALALIHSSMSSVLLSRTKRNASQITAYDRFVFWDDTSAEVLEQELERRHDWHMNQLGRRSESLLALTRAASAAHPVLGLRDAAIAFTHAIDAIHTDGGESSSPKSCSVYGAGEAHRCIDQARSHLVRSFNTTGSRRDLMHAVKNHIDAGRGVIAPPAPFTPLSYDDLARRLAGDLASTDFTTSFGTLVDLERLHQQHSHNVSDVEENISVWDKINVFTKTDDERARDELRQDMGELRDRMDDFSHVDSLFDDALRRIYPPAILAYSLSGVSHAVSSIRAVCRSRTVTVGTGDNKRTETRYYCDLVGKGAATGAARTFNRNLVSSWGDLPDHHSLLARWAARDAVTRRLAR